MGGWPIPELPGEVQQSVLRSGGPSDFDVLENMKLTLCTFAEEQSNDVCTAANKTRTDARPTRWEPDIFVDKT